MGQSYPGCGDHGELKRFVLDFGINGVGAGFAWIRMMEAECGYAFGFVAR